MSYLLGGKSQRRERAQGLKEMKLEPLRAGSNQKLSVMNVTNKRGFPPLALKERTLPGYTVITCNKKSSGAPQPQIN